MQSVTNIVSGIWIYSHIPPHAHNSPGTTEIIFTQTLSEPVSYCLDPQWYRILDSNSNTLLSLEQNGQ